MCHTQELAHDRLPKRVVAYASDYNRELEANRRDNAGDARRRMMSAKRDVEQALLHIGKLEDLLASVRTAP